jgi:hypothetical protein
MVYVLLSPLAGESGLGPAPFSLSHRERADSADRPSGVRGVNSREFTPLTRSRSARLDLSLWERKAENSLLTLFLSCATHAPASDHGGHVLEASLNMRSEVRRPGEARLQRGSRRPGLWCRRKTNRRGVPLGPLPATGRTNGTREGWASPMENLRWVLAANSSPQEGQKPSARGTLTRSASPR